MYGAKLLTSDDCRRTIMKITTIATANKIWSTKNPKFFHCETLPRQTVSSAIPNF
jgi:hypothetical protein